MATSRLSVHYLPQFVGESDLAGRVVVVVDLLRASSTICQALASGALDVQPFLEVGDALTAATQFDRSEVVLGGERGGRRIDNFDLGNSPREYTPDQVFGRRVLFTTTNGTKALIHARLAERVLIGAVLNRSAMVAALKNCPRVDILCAGTAGHVSRDDLLAAGAIVHALTAQTPAGSSNTWQLDEPAEAVRREWEELTTTARAMNRTVGEQLARELRGTPGGRNLLEIGQDDDLEFCSRIDRLDVVPELDTGTQRVYLP